MAEAKRKYVVQIYDNLDSREYTVDVFAYDARDAKYQAEIEHCRQKDIKGNLTARVTAVWPP